MNSKPKIFFSYAWGDASDKPGEGREQLVNELYDSLLKENFNPVRDKNNVQYRDFISDFMAELGQGKCIVVAISEKYLKSPYCMFELYEIARHSSFNKYDFRDKIIPIMVEPVDFNKPATIDYYLSYWQNEYKTWNDLVSRRAGELAVEQMQRFDKVKMVYQNFGKLTDWLTDINMLNAQVLSKNNFAAIKEAIVAKALPVTQGDVIDFKSEDHGPLIKKRTSWPVILVSIITVMLTGFIVFVHVSSLSIELDLAVSELNFRLSEQQVFTNELGMVTLGVSGLQDVQLPVGQDTLAGTAIERTLVLLSVDSSKQDPGSISLDAQALQAGTQLGMRVGDITGQYRMSMTWKEFKIPVHVNGRVDIAMPPDPLRRAKYSSPQSIHLLSGAGQVDLDFTPAPGLKNVFAGSVPVDSLSFLRIDQHFDNNFNKLDSVSTILSGSMIFEPGRRHEQKISKNEFIKFQSVKGEIRTLELQGNHLGIVFSGVVWGMTGIDSGKRVNLMPTYLQWLWRNHRAMFISLATLFILAIIFSAWRWRM